MVFTQNTDKSLLNETLTRIKRKKVIYWQKQKSLTNIRCIFSNTRCSNKCLTKHNILCNVSNIRSLSVWCFSFVHTIPLGASLTDPKTLNWSFGVFSFIPIAFFFSLCIIVIESNKVWMREKWISYSALPSFLIPFCYYPFSRRY